MNKPHDYENIKLSNYEELKAGGHKCVIKMAEEYKSESGKDMLRIHFDTDLGDTQPLYFTNRYKNDTSDNKKWRGIYNYYVQGDEFGNKNIKALVTSVEESNPGAKVVWGDGFCNWLKNKKIGIVFRHEEYLGNNSEVKMSTKPMYVCSFDKASDQKVPATKLLASTPMTGRMSDQGTDWMKVDGASDEGLPWN